MTNEFPFGDDIETSAVAQLIECGLVARYKGDPEGLKWARNQLRKEVQAKGWILSPYSDAAHDFSHQAMHQLSDWPVLERLVRARKSGAKRLDSRAIAAIYGEAEQLSWAEISDLERDFATTAIKMHCS